jgi:two-component system LytT family response regulator
MSLKCIVIDKEFSAIELMSNFSKSFPGLRLLEFFDNVIAGSEYMRHNNIDLLFIELSMPADSAIKLVRSISEKIIVIFTVACKQLTPEVLDMDILDYLVKPITFARFAKAVAKATDRYRNITPEKETGGTI